MTTTADSKRIHLSARDLYFAAHHQSAQAVVAILLGCEVSYVEVGSSPESMGWNLDSVSPGDSETICAAGYAMEIILGRRPEMAWSHCSADFHTLKRVGADRIAETPDVAALTARFLSAADASRTILSHRSVRQQIDDLAESLSDAYLAGDGKLDRSAITSIIGNQGSPTTIAELA